MYARTISASVFGIDAFRIEVETHIDTGLPGFQIVGLPDSAVRESRERVMAAIKNSGYDIPARKIMVNLAPADVRKEGSAFDLPVAVGILAAYMKVMPKDLDTTVMLGELAFDGSLRTIHGVLPIALAMRGRRIRRMIVPVRNAGEAAIVDGVDVIPVATLVEALEYLEGSRAIEPHRVDVDRMFEAPPSVQMPDIHDVKGQEAVKRAMEVAAAGGHNMIMVGPPGAGKTMLAKRIATILPPLSLAEALETTKIHSVAGLLPSGTAMVTQRPFRAPHHTISDAALVGGGVGVVRAGEISLAHHGVLFLDEVPEFQRNVLEVLRQPLEDKYISIARSKMSVEYPANFMLVCSMNPCPCGQFGNAHQECTCSQHDIQRYMSRISGPLLDRIDIHVDVPAVRIHELAGTAQGETSAVIRGRVVHARRRQAARFERSPHLHKNADMSGKDVERHCRLDEESLNQLRTAMTRLGLSARAYDRILKVSRTIADLAGSDAIDVGHVREAIQYRSLDRPYWNG